MENTIKVGSVVVHTNHNYTLADFFRGPGTVTKLFSEFGVDFASVLWQSSLVEFDHRLTNLQTLAEKESK